VNLSVPEAGVRKVQTGKSLEMVFGTFPVKGANRAFRREGPMGRMITEKRNLDRYEYVAEVIFHRGDPNMFHRAVMKNYGSGGMCLESKHSLREGERIRVVMPFCSPELFGPESHCEYSGEVIWVRKVGKSQVVGLRYPEPVLYA